MTKLCGGNEPGKLHGGISGVRKCTGVQLDHIRIHARGFLDVLQIGIDE